MLSYAEIREAYQECVFRCAAFTQVTVDLEGGRDDCLWRPYGYAGHVRPNPDGSLALSESTPSDKPLASTLTFSLGGYFEVEAKWEPGVNASPWTGWPMVCVESDQARIGIVEYLGKPDEERICSFQVADISEAFKAPSPEFYAEYHKYGLLWWPATYFSDGRLEWCVDGEVVASLGYRKDSDFARIDEQSFRIAMGANNAMPITVKSVTVWQ